MLALPPIPTWQSLHPLVIHFPIALLLTAPILVLIAAAVKPEKARPYLQSALILMLLGTAAIFVAVESGEAAGRLAERSPQINATLAMHEHLAERTRMLFTALTLSFALIVFMPILLKKQTRLVTSALPAVFLGMYVLGMLSLANTAHNGGRLVHEFGVHAVMAPSPTPTPPTTEAEGD